MPGRPYWRWRRRGRPPKPRFLQGPMHSLDLVYLPYPLGENPSIVGEPVILYPDEVEALRLVYLEGLTQGEAAQIMGVSRGTLWRIIDNARRKIVFSIIEGRPLVVRSKSG